MEIELLINWTKCKTGVLGKTSEVQQPNGLDLREVGSTTSRSGTHMDTSICIAHTFKGNNTTTGN